MVKGIYLWPVFLQCPNSSNGTVLVEWRRIIDLLYIPETARVTIRLVVGRVVEQE